MTSFFLQLWWPHYSMEPVRWKVNKKRQENWWDVSTTIEIEKGELKCFFKGFSIMVVGLVLEGVPVSTVLQILRVCLRNWLAFSPSALLEPIYSFWLCHMFFCITSVLLSDLSCQTPETNICDLFLIIHLYPAELWTGDNLYAYPAAFCIIMNVDIMNKSCTVY